MGELSKIRSVHREWADLCDREWKCCFMQLQEVLGKPEESVSSTKHLLWAYHHCDHHEWNQTVLVYHSWLAWIDDRED